jgi:hypothetical protein
VLTLSAPNTKRDDARITTAERRSKVIELRRRRMSFAEIGEQLGVTTQRAHAIYREALAAIPAQHVEEHRAEELTLIDDAIADLLVIAQDHTRPRNAIEAWNSIRGWAERKAKLLGLDAPAKFEVLTMDAIDEEIKKLQAELAASDQVTAE